MKAIQVKALEDYKIDVTFDDGVSGIIDLNDLVQKGIFQSLKEPGAFAKVYIDGVAIAWSEELEIDADTVYAEILKTEPSELLHHSYHAAD